jgi:PAS domain S-box-containing protein
MVVESAYPEEILVVDDSAGNLKLLEEILTAGGYRVRLASDGELALRSALVQPPSLILLDIRMPGMDGFEVCRRLKADGATCNIPVIFLSILEDEGDKVKGFRLGAVDYVTKPFHPEEVLVRVTMHLALKSARQALEARNAELEEIRATLEERIRERTAALENANRALEAEIDGHRWAEAALRESEARYRRIVDTANEGIWALGPDSMTTFVNARMVELVGHPAAEMIGRPVTDFMFPEDAPDHHQKMENRRQGIAEHYERRFLCSDGETVCCLASAAPIFDDSHCYQGCFAMFTDITERKLADEELRRLKGELELRVLERTAELEAKNADLEKMLKAFVGRELKMIELKERIRALEKAATGGGSNQ